MNNLRRNREFRRRVVQRRKRLSQGECGLPSLNTKARKTKVRKRERGKHGARSFCNAIFRVFVFRAFVIGRLGHKSIASYSTPTSPATGRAQRNRRRKCVAGVFEGTLGNWVEAGGRGKGGHKGLRGMSAGRQCKVARIFGCRRQAKVSLSQQNHRHRYL